MDIAAIKQLVKNLDESLPHMPDPEAVPEDPCITIELSWRDWSLIKKLAKEFEETV